MEFEKQLETQAEILTRQAGAKLVEGTGYLAGDPTAEDDAKELARKASQYTQLLLLFRAMKHGDSEKEPFDFMQMDPSDKL